MTTQTPDAVREAAIELLAKAAEHAGCVEVPKGLRGGDVALISSEIAISAILAALDSSAGDAGASNVICEDVTCDGDPCTATQKAAETCDAGEGWRCYHCGDTFTDDQSARLHFGRDEDSDPACQIKAGAEHGLLGALREAEYAAADAQQAIANECTEAAKAYYAQATRHAAALRNAEEAGYERGLADGRALSATTAPAVDAASASIEGAEADLTHEERVSYEERILALEMDIERLMKGEQPIYASANLEARARQVLRADAYTRGPHVAAMHDERALVNVGTAVSAMMTLAAAPKAVAAPAVDAVPAGEVDCSVCGGDCAGANPPVMNCPMLAALSHGEGRK